MSDFISVYADNRNYPMLQSVMNENIRTWIDLGVLTLYSCF